MLERALQLNGKEFTSSGEATDALREIADEGPDSHAQRWQELLRDTPFLDEITPASPPDARLDEAAPPPSRTSRSTTLSKRFPRPHPNRQRHLRSLFSQPTNQKSRPWNQRRFGILNHRCHAVRLRLRVLASVR
jgi:hypothetical protein